MKIHWQLVEGGEKGQSVAHATLGIINKFFSIGVKNIEAECNIVASKYRTLWNAKPSSDLMTEHGLGLTYADGCIELEPEFKLFEPTSIIIQILDCHSPHKGSPAAFISYLNQDIMNPVLTIYLKELEQKDSTFVWKAFYLPFECIVNHELLHACGDSPIFREVRDGIIRPNIIGWEAINNLTRKL